MDMNLEHSADGCRDVGRVVAALERHGCYVLRGALPVAAVDRIAARVRQGYDELESAHACGALSPEAERRCYSYGILRPFEDDLADADGRPLRDTMQDLVRQGLLCEVIRGYLGDEVTLLLEACHVRRQGPDQVGRPVPLHQDASVMRMRSGRLLNFWVPLVDGAGADAPGLEFYPKSLSSVVEPARRPAGENLRQRLYSNFELDAEAVRGAVGELALWSPVLDRGDVLCLDGWSIHRTNFSPAMTRTRYDFELRFCRTADLQDGMPGATLGLHLDEWAA